MVDFASISRGGEGGSAAIFSVLEEEESGLGSVSSDGSTTTRWYIVWELR